MEPFPKDILHTIIRSNQLPPVKSANGYVVIARGIHESATEDDLYDLFGREGKVPIVNLHYNLLRPDGGPAGYALIEYLDPDLAEEVIQALHRSQFKGRRIKLDWAFRHPRETR